MMLKRPKPGEKDEDLIKQDKEYKSEKKDAQTYPSAKVVLVGKRKTEEIGNTVDTIQNNLGLCLFHFYYF